MGAKATRLRARIFRAAGAGWVVASALAFGCRTAGDKDEPDPTEPSPNASILPAPLVSAGDRRRPGASPADAGADAAADASPRPPEHFADDESLVPEPSLGREDLGATLKAELQLLRTEDARSDAARRDHGSLRLTIELAANGRSRVVIDSEAFVLPAGTELRARRENWGYLLLWPGGAGYRVLPPGRLRALFGEGRADAVPLMPAKLKPKPPGKALGYDVERVEASTSLGSVSLAQARIPALMTGGQLVCRLLLELIAADPETPACDSSLPLRATFEWETEGSMLFEVTSLTRRQDLSDAVFAMPPAGVEFRPGELPIAASVRSLMRQRDAEPGGNVGGLELSNQLDGLVYARVDNRLAAWLGPAQRITLPDVRAGKVTVSWHDFYGSPLGTQGGVAVPGRFVLGSTPDGGAPQTP